MTEQSLRVTAEALLSELAGFRIVIVQFVKTARNRRDHPMVGPIEIIPMASVLTRAKTLVAESHTELSLTMSALEERSNPIPSDYFALLRSRMSSGVAVTRIGFGTWADFMPIADRILIPDPHYTFLLTPETGYRRMLLVDRTKLLFARFRDGVKQVGYTEDPSVVAEYREYFRVVRDSARPVAAGLPMDKSARE